MRSCVLVLWLCFIMNGVAEEPAWSQWRGPARDGQSSGPAWPETLDGDHLKQLWRVELGPSYSGPIVTADRVFVTETKDKSHEVVRALDRKSGKEIWKTQWEGALTVPFFAAANGSWIRATPAVDDESLYVAGMRDLLVCLNVTNGNERWRVDLAKKFGAPLPSFGFASSPLVTQDALYVQAGGGVIKLDKAKGDVLWRAADDGGGMNGSAFASPVMATFKGQSQLVVLQRERMAGLDPAKGELLWTQPVPAFRGMNILTPVIYKSAIFTSTYGGKTLLYTVDQQGGRFTTSTTWSLPGQGYMSTPVVIDGHAYLHLRSQRVACINLDSGERTWHSERGFGKYWSMVARGKLILALEETGNLFLLKANSEKMEILSSKQISEQETWAHLAVYGNEIFVRELNAITAYRLVGARGTGPP